MLIRFCSISKQVKRKLDNKYKMIISDFDLLKQPEYSNLSQNQLHGNGRSYIPPEVALPFLL